MEVFGVGPRASLSVLPPVRALLPFVSGYRIGNFRGPSDRNVIAISPPAVEMELVFTTQSLERSSLGATTVHRPGAFVLGPIRAERSTRIQPIPSGARVATVVFKAGAGPYFLRILAGEMLDLVLDARDVLPASTAAGIDQVVDALADNVKDALDRFLLRIFSELPARSGQIDDLTMLESVLRGSTTLEIAQRAALSERQITRRFHRAFGMTPSRIRRIARFSKACEAIVDQPDSSMADIAATFGYSDQAHMAREFRSFAGVSPSDYLDKRASALYLEGTLA